MTSEKQQVLKLMTDSRHVLITTRHQADYDEMATGLAWLAWLKQKGKRADLVVDNDNLKRFDWLPESQQIKLCEHQPQRFTIRLKTDDFKLGELSYELKDNHVEIYLTPKEGRIEPHHIEHVKDNFPYDLVITLGAPDLNSLGRVGQDYRQGLLETPIINIDRRPDNTNYGQLNLVELTATSLAEICFDFFEPELNKTLAYYLLTALISATNSFQTPQVTPQTLKIASQLIVAGAPREEIVLCLYRTKDLATLKTWGVILSRLEQRGPLVYSQLSPADLGEQTIDWKALSDELILASPTAELAALFYEQAPDKIIVRLHAKANYDLMALLGNFQPTGHKRYVEFELPGSLPQVTSQVVDQLLNKLKLINS